MFYEQWGFHHRVLFWNFMFNNYFTYLENTNLILSLYFFSPHRGVSLEETESEGNTALHIAAMAGRAHNVDLILRHLIASGNFLFFTLVTFYIYYCTYYMKNQISFNCNFFLNFRKSSIFMSYMFFYFSPSKILFSSYFLVLFI